MNSTRSVVHSSPVSEALARNRLGKLTIVSFVMCAAAPVTVGAGVIPTAFATTGTGGLPLAFILIGAVLAVFSVGFNAMSRHISNAGAFYAYISQGLTKPLGVAGAWVAMLAYNLLQVGLYGAIGTSVSPLMQSWLGWHLPWWSYALAAWAIVAGLGLLRVDINGRILALLLILEIAVVLLFDVANLLNPAGGTIGFESFHPSALFTSGFGAVFVIGITGFVGFEASAIFAEEARDPRKTVPAATMLCLIVIAVLYSLTAWSMTVATGPDQIASYAGQQQGETMFSLASANLGPSFSMLGHILFATSVLAAMISYHNAVGRYAFALGREGVLPSWFGMANRQHAPLWGSLFQTLIGLAVIVGYAVAGLDPLVQLFFWLGTTGGFGVLILLTVTSVAVLGYRLNRKGENVWRAIIAPLIALVALLFIIGAAALNFSTLLGVAPDSPLRWIFPSAFAVAALIGVARAGYLYAVRPQVYRGIGLGVDSRAGRSEAPGVRAGAREEGGL